MADKPQHGFLMWRMMWNNVAARPLRSGLSVIAIALQIFLILLIVGLTSGVVAEWANRVEGVGADIMVQPPNSSIFLGLTSPVMQESIADSVAQVPGVDEVASVLMVMDTQSFIVVYGIDYQRFTALSKGFLFRAGRPFVKPDEALADNLVAQSRRLRLGSKVTMIGHEFAICGIVEHGKGARFFVPLRTAQDYAGADKRVSIFYVRSRGDTEGTRAEIVKLLPTYRVRSMAEYLTLMNSSNLPELRPFIRSMVGLGVTISFLVVLLTMHTLVLERTREIGILKALGSSRFDILRLFVGETLVMTLLGIVLGMVTTYVVCAVLKYTSPTLAIKITTDWIFRAMLLAIAGAVAGALYPASRAARSDPVDALAYE